MVAPRTVAILFSALFLLALVPTDIAAIQIDSDLTTTVDVAGDGPYIFSIVSDGGSRLLIDGVVVSTTTERIRSDPWRATRHF